ncbi:cyclic nucleotide-binding domain-containing protein 2-like [Ptychodera flava]|uniref:cyclic nucleotide-binding domain-containing protein 2-like n=1 Tax=Ptychodera flava TaxID=63121 RepID=UPI00396A1F27
MPANDCEDVCSFTACRDKNSSLEDKTPSVGTPPDGRPRINFNGRTSKVYLMPVSITTARSDHDPSLSLFAAVDHNLVDHTQRGNNSRNVFPVNKPSCESSASGDMESNQERLNSDKTLQGFRKSGETSENQDRRSSGQDSAISVSPIMSSFRSDSCPPQSMRGKRARINGRPGRPATANNNKNRRLSRTSLSNGKSESRATISTDVTISASSSSVKAGKTDFIKEILSKVRAESRARRLSRMSEDQRREMLKKHRSSTMSAESLVKWLQEKRKADEDADFIKRRKARARQRFQRIIRLVRRLCGITKRMKIFSVQKTMQTAAESHYHTVYNSKVVSDMAFNKAKFMRGTKEFSRVPNWAKEIIEKPSDMRTDGELRQIHALLRGLKSFDKFTHTIQMVMCKAFTYELIEPERIILRKGHIGQNFYFIYSGSVFVNTEELNPATRRTFVKTEAVLSRGDAFGELSLLRDIKRTATVSSRETCELLVVEREVFAEICPMIFDQELEAKIQFLGNLQIFDKYWSEESLKDLCAEGQIQEFKTNRVVTADCIEDGDSIYICMEGRCRILKYLLLDESFRREEDQGEGDEEVVDLAILLTHQTIGRTIFKREDFTDDKKTSAEHKSSMLSAMHLDYVDRPYAMGETEVAELDEGGNLVIKENIQTNPSSVGFYESFASNMSLSSFMKLQAKKMCKRDIVYLDVGVLKSSQIFNLEELLHPTPRDKGLVLVSNGTKLLRIKRTLLFRLATTEALSFARTIASQQSYPTKEVLINSYGEHTRWEDYKQRVVSDTLTSAGKITSDRELNNRKQIRHQMRRRDNRLQSTLEREQQQDQQQRMMDFGCMSSPAPVREKRSNVWFDGDDFFEDDGRPDSPTPSGLYETAFLVPLPGGGFTTRRNSLLVQKLITPAVDSSQLDIVIDAVTQVRFN